MVIIKSIWYLAGIILSICILINNPKSNNIGISNRTSTSSEFKKTIKYLTWINIVIFIVSTILLVRQEN